MINTARVSQRMHRAPGLSAEIPGRLVPFDHTFQIKLEGEPQKTHRAKLTVSVEAFFTAVSIGYGVVPELTPIIFGPIRAAPGSASALGSGSKPVQRRLRDINLGELMDALENSLRSSPDVPKGMPVLEAALLNGIRLNSKFSGLGLLGDGNALMNEDSLQKLFQLVSAPDRDVQFLYALFDEGTGREFQSDPLLNTAALGAPDGKRPFRYFAKPITFAPLTTIRMDITELGDFRGELHVSLQGYKFLGGADTPTARTNTTTRRRMR